MIIAHEVGNYSLAISSKYLYGYSFPALKRLCNLHSLPHRLIH